MSKRRRRVTGPRGGGERRNFTSAGNDPFTCLVCGCEVLPLSNGSFRSHCPSCLWSRHVDCVPGDRASECGGLMEPIGLEGSEGTGWSLVHQCVDCGAVRRNRTAQDDPRQPDVWEQLVEIASSPRAPSARGPRRPRQPPGR